MKITTQAIRIYDEGIFRVVVNIKDSAISRIELQIEGKDSLILDTKEDLVLLSRILNAVAQQEGWFTVSTRDSSGVQH